MHQMAVTSKTLETIDFTPTIIVGFYRSDSKHIFAHEYKILRDRYPDVEIIGCSSESTVSNDRPYVDVEHDTPCVYMCTDMSTAAYDIVLCADDEPIEKCFEDDYSTCQAVVLSSNISLTCEDRLEALASRLGSHRVYGAVASGEGYSDMILDEDAEIFYNGRFYTEHMLIWLIDERYYGVDSISVHHFGPEAMPLQVTKSDGFKLLELDHKPALDVIEDLLGRLDEELIRKFGYPFFWNNGVDDWESASLVALLEADRENKTVTILREIGEGQLIKPGIMRHPEIFYERIRELYPMMQNADFMLYFACVAVEKSLGTMEFLYIEDFRRETGAIPMVGFHTFGEIGKPALMTKTDKTVVHNQTITVVCISDRGDK